MAGEGSQGGQQFDAPNQEAVGQPPPWVEGTGSGEGSETPTPPADESVEPAQSGDDLEALTKEQLLERARELEVTPANEGMTKAELIDGIRAAGG